MKKMTQLQCLVLVVFTVLMSTNLKAQDLISGGSNSWVLHTPDDGRRMIYFTPGVNSSNWEWDKWTAFYQANGANISVETNGRFKSNSTEGGLWLSNANDGFVGNFGSNIGFWTNGKGWETFQINKTSGNVGIGTATPDAKLTVAGNIKAREVEVKITAGADFVFEEDYNLPKLNEVEAFIKTNKHLPGIQSEKDMQENGLNLNEMNIRLLQKVEELTLYIIEQQKMIEKQQVQINKYLKQ